MINIKFTKLHRNTALTLALGVLSGMFLTVLLFQHDKPNGDWISNFLWDSFGVSVPSGFIQKDSNLALEIGEHYFNWGRKGEYNLNKAEQYLKRAIQIDPNLSGPWYQLGRIDFLRSRFFSAVNKFNKQIEVSGDDQKSIYFLPTHYMRGLTYGFLKKFDLAKDDFLFLIERYIPESGYAFWAAYVDLSWVYFQEGKYKEIEKLTREGLERYPDNPWLLNMRGLALINLDRAAEAREYFELSLSEAQKLTPAEWGRSYPGNDPKIAPVGLQEMLTTIEQNLGLVSEATVGN